MIKVRPSSHCIILIEARDEFEDPEEDIRRIYVLKLFNGVQEWNYGLFVQEIFKLETKESLYYWRLAIYFYYIEEGGVCWKVHK